MDKEIIGINVDGQKGWIHKDELDALHKWERQRKKVFMIYWRNPKARELNEERALARRRGVYAFIMVGSTQKMCYYDREAKKAFKLDVYSATWMEWKRFKFIRFCTSMDL